LPLTFFSILAVTSFFFTAIPYTSRLDTYSPKRLLGISHFTKILSLQFVDILRRRFEKQEHGFSWRYEARGAFFCFDGEGEEEEE
jgi:hypothetical protein